MITSRCITTLIIFLSTIVVSGSLGYGQWEDPYGGQPPYGYPPGGGGNMPANYLQGPQNSYPAGNPNLNPYPGIEMYNYASQQTYNDNGIWMRRNVGNGSHYTGSVEFIIPYFDDPHGTFWGYGGGFDSLIQRDGFFNAQDFAPRRNATTTPFQNSNIAGLPLDMGKVFQNDEPGVGMRLTFGYENEDGSGLKPTWLLD